MDIRYHIDPDTGEPHIYGHHVDEEDVEDVLDAPVETRAGRRDSRSAFGLTRDGRWLRVFYVEDAKTDSVFVITAYAPSPQALAALRRRRRK